MEWYVEHSPYSGDYDPIQEVVVKDSQTLVFKLRSLQLICGQYLLVTTMGLMMLKLLKN